MIAPIIVPGRRRMREGTRAAAIPPPRYRIVERGRRLEVIDTHAGGTPTAPPSDRDQRDRAALPTLAMRRTRFDGSAELTTSRFYDDKGPRLIALDAVSAAQLGRTKLAAIVLAMAYVLAVVWQPWLIAAVLLPLRDGIRRPVRAAITRWLDRVVRQNGPAG